MAYETDSDRGLLYRMANALIGLGAGTQVVRSVRPPSTVSAALSNTIATSGGTTAVAFTNTTDTEIINPSAATLWASWGTPAVNGAGSFPILPNGSYQPPSRPAGTLTLLSTAASQPFTVNRYS